MNSCMYVEPNNGKNQYTINLAIGNLTSLKNKHKPTKQKAADRAELFLFSADVWFIRHTAQIRFKCANMKNVNISLLLLSV